MSTSSAPRSRVAIWIAAARLRTLPAAVVPVVVGTAVAYACGHIAWGPALAALAGAIAIQIGTNFANDVFDAEKGADTPERIGPLRVVSAGLVSTGAMKRAMVVAFGAAVLAGLYLVSVAGWPIVAIGIASILSGIAYTGGPWPLGYHGLGDVFVMLFFGFVAVCGTAFVQLERVPMLAIWASIPVGALATAILVVNNVRDRLGDARAGKRTLAVRFGRRAALVEYVVLLALAFVVPLVLCLDGLRTAALPLVLTPLAVMRTTSLVAAVTGPEHNRLLAATAQLLLLHGALFATGLALG
ncbi:MAG TPA: 1,4-dihydroxy-2-naphthoate polyprenyltransferase [Kofleriaceae bacterium]|jgi:1,4-dihydroxy-2-naphthoate octaprenyltransferase|nr:1,4-dihydroxy-2-naphthoate polyprenyltransferase [Kofleriaceae bacterium]